MFIGSKDETSLVDKVISGIKRKDQTINLSGKTSVPELFSIIKNCNLFVGNDSGPMHIGAAMGTPTIGLFGPNIPLRWKPFGINRLGKNNIGLYKGSICKFSPCINVHKGEIPECNFGIDNKCIKNIKVEDVLLCIEKLIHKNNDNI